MDFGILVYPPETGGEPWRAVFTENGQRKYRQGATEAKLAEKLEKVRERLQADAVNMERSGADLIKHYLDPDRLPAGDRWSRKHAHTQRRLCERFAEPVIGAVTCQDIKTGHMQQIVNAAPTAGEGDWVHGMLSALVTAGIEGGLPIASPQHTNRAPDAGNLAEVQVGALATRRSWLDERPARARAVLSTRQTGQLIPTHDEFPRLTQLVMLTG